jgi:ribosomal protein S27AE
MAEENWVCRKCGSPLEKRKMIFSYLGSNISYELPACPNCGTFLVPRELAEGKIAETETLLEDK